MRTTLSSVSGNAGGGELRRQNAIRCMASHVRSMLLRAPAEVAAKWSLRRAAIAVSMPSSEAAVAAAVAREPRAPEGAQGGAAIDLLFACGMR